MILATGQRKLRTGRPAECLYRRHSSFLLHPKAARWTCQLCEAGQAGDGLTSGKKQSLPRAQSHPDLVLKHQMSHSKSIRAGFFRFLPLDGAHPPQMTPVLIVISQPQFTFTFLLKVNTNSSFSLCICIFKYKLLKLFVILGNDSKFQV